MIQKQIKTTNFGQKVEKVNKKLAKSKKNQQKTLTHFCVYDIIMLEKM